MDRALAAHHEKRIAQLKRLAKGRNLTNDIFPFTPEGASDRQ
jgi:hypothetical protein